ncbi:MAG TPA: CYCXC family (seleno)protein [Planktothrix sp.]|jgi:hypothetical protein
MRNHKRLALGLASAALAGALVVAFQLKGVTGPSTAPAGSGSSTATSAGPAPAAKVLDPEKFFGDAQVGYQSAQQCPEVAAKLFCYCGCDITDSHTSLLDCFTSDHGADCPICTGEAVTALALKREHKTLAQIQQAIDKQYAKEYPYEQPSKALRDYRAHRLYQPDAKDEPAAKHNHPGAPPKLKAGREAGNCCGNKKQS